MLSAEDNELLTRNGPGTGMGEFFRRFWMPVALSRELPEPDCAPIRVRVMGEDLIAFRASDGRVGLIEPRCAHRGADLFYGRNEDNGLRCCYHGWKYDVEGCCTEMPNVPADAAYHGKIHIKAYPTREFGEMVWAYLGPTDKLPALPELEFGVLPAAHRYVSKKLQQCNWAQSVEGALDTAHFSFLHMPAPKMSAAINAGANADAQRLKWMRDDPMPRFSIAEHPVGFAAGAARDGDPGELYWRVSQFMLPNHSLAPNALPGENYQGQTWVPIDDESCWIYTYAWNPVRPLSNAERSKIEGGHGVFAQLGEQYVPLRNRTNEYLIDRADQKSSSFTGIKGVAEQDAMVQDSQGYIVDRTREHLTPTDAAAVRFRRIMLAGVKALRTGQEPAAAGKASAYLLRGGSWVAKDSTSFEDMMQERFQDPTGRAVT